MFTRPINMANTCVCMCVYICMYVCVCAYVCAAITETFQWFMCVVSIDLLETVFMNSRLS